MNTELAEEMGHRRGRINGRTVWSDDTGCFDDDRDERMAHCCVKSCEAPIDTEEDTDSHCVYCGNRSCELHRRKYGDEWICPSCDEKATAAREGLKNKLYDALWRLEKGHALEEVTESIDRDCDEALAWACYQLPAKTTADGLKKGNSSLGTVEKSEALPVSVAGTTVREFIGLHHRNAAGARSWEAGRPQGGEAA